MTKDSHAATIVSNTSTNQMLGSQLVSKSIASKLPSASGKQQATTIAKQTSVNKNTTITAATGNGSQPASLRASSHSASGHNVASKQEQPTSPKKAPSSPSTTKQNSEVDKKKPAQATSNSNTRTSPQQANTTAIKDNQKVAATTSSPKDGATNSTKLKSVLCKTQEARSKDVEHHALEAERNEYLNSHQQVSSPASHHGGSMSGGGVSAKDMELLVKEAQDLKSKTRKLHLEVDEKNEIINVLKDELETLREQSDKFQRENIQLIKDAKRVKFLQDENDFLQDKVSQVEKLELEIKRLKEKLQEVEFFKIRINELEEDLSKSQEQSNLFEESLRQAESRLTRVSELECELTKWKSFSHELEQEKNSIQGKLLESIDHEAKLTLVNKKVEDEVRRLRDLIKSYEEQRDEEQASNSFIMSVADLKQLDQQENNRLSVDAGTDPHNAPSEERGQQTDTSDTSEKACDTDQVGQLKSECNDVQRKLLDSENQLLRDELKRQEAKLADLAEGNKKIFTELDGNRKVISDLRQDLACEKSLTQKLTSQLSSFTRQIKSLDKQYFPMHDTSSTSATTTSATTINLNVSDRPLRASDGERADSSSAISSKSSPLKTVTTIEHKQLPQHSGKSLNERDRRTDLLAKAADEGANELEPNSCNSFVAGDNGTCGRIDNETSQQADQENDDAELSSSEHLSTAAQATTTTGTTRTIAQQLKSNREENALRKSQVSEKKNFPSNGTDSQAKAPDLPRVGVEDGKQQVAAKFASRPDSSTPGSSILSNKSDDSSGGHASRPASGGTGQAKLVSTMAASANKSRDGIAAANSTVMGADAHERQQHRLGAPLATTASSKDTLLSSMIDGGQSEEPKTNRRHANIDSGNPIIGSTTIAVGATSSTSVKDNNSIHQSTKRVGCGGSTSSSLSPSSSARSQSSSPPSVAATLSHDSGFQSINHDFGQQISPKPSGARPTDAITSLADCADRPQKQKINLPPGPSRAATDRSIPSNSERKRESPARSSTTMPTRHTTSRESNRCAPSSRDNRATEGDEESDELEDNLTKMAPDAGKSSGTSTRSHFVRNSLPSRSVNFGHSSRSSAYLDRIRASVTATTTTTNQLASSFSNEQSVSNVTLANQTAPASVHQVQLSQAESQLHSNHGFVLNCMLDHPHSQRCFAKIERPAHVHVSQPGIYENPHHSQLANHLQQQQQQHSHHPAAHPHQHHEHHLHPQVHGQAPSRQLSALIDPVAHQQLFLGMLQQQQQKAARAQGQPLTEQQLLQLNHLHRQHYYHHLHQLHQMHHQHHLYHMHQMQQQQQQQHPPPHKCQSAAQGPTSQAGNPQAPDARAGQAAASPSAPQDLYASCGGSQFYAPNYEQVYANLKEPAPNSKASRRRQSFAQASPQRTEPLYQTASRGGAQRKQLAQIDELTNGLPTVDQLEAAKAVGERARRTSDATSGRPSQPGQQRQSPLFSSPTSSRNSSNISPSSETSASSTSSTNFLTTSAHLSRSALRHTTTQLGRREFSVERDLTSMAPQTATLSRVGSCRGFLADPSSSEVTRLSAAQISAGSEQNTMMMMRNPVKSQQPPMRTSKILNIGSQQTGGSSNSANNNNCDPIANQVAPMNNNAQAVDGLSRLANNLANIKLGDNLAFSSLRMPKKSSSGSSLNTSLNLARQRVANSGGGRVSSTSSSPDKVRLLRSAARQAVDGAAGSNNNNNNNNGGKSSVWFEYGCI